MKHQIAALAAGAMVAAGCLYDTPLAPFTSPIHRRRVIRVKNAYVPDPGSSDQAIREHNAAVEAANAAKRERQARQKAARKAGR